MARLIHFLRMKELHEGITPEINKIKFDSSVEWKIVVFPIYCTLHLKFKLSCQVVQFN